MASQAKVMGSVTETVRFLIERLQNEIVENRHTFGLNDDQVRKLVHLTDTSLQDSYNRSMNQILKTLE